MRGSVGWWDGGYSRGVLKTVRSEAQAAAVAPEAEGLQQDCSRNVFGLGLMALETKGAFRTTGSTSCTRDQQYSSDRGCRRSPGKQGSRGCSSSSRVMLLQDCVFRTTVSSSRARTSCSSSGRRCRRSSKKRESRR